MISVGDSVWIEEDDGYELDEVNLVQLRVIDINQDILRNSLVRYYRLENEQWHSKEEVFLNKKDLVNFLIEQNKESQEDLVLDIESIIHELEDLKEKARLFRTRQDVLEKLKETI
jgi:hypothetical protein